MAHPRQARLGGPARPDSGADPDDDESDDVRRTRDANAFLAAVGSFLCGRPVEHSVLLGTAAAAAGGAGGDAVGLWVRRGGDVRAAAHHVPGHPAHLSVAEAPDVRVLAAALRALAPHLPAVSGPGTGPEVFARQWQDLGGGGWEVARRFGVYRAERVHVPDVPGRPREAGEADTALLQEWVRGFGADTGLPVPGADALRERVADRRVLVWVDGRRPVAMAAVTAPQAGAVRVQLVYTPPPLRGNGYASACTAALTAREMSVPGRICILHTDLANPTANRIYPAVGYRRVAEATEVRLGA